MMPLGVGLSIAALVLLVSGRAATRRYLEIYLERYGTPPPGLSWFFRADPDPEVEASRRKSLAVRLPAITLVIIGTILVFGSTP